MEQTLMELVGERAQIMAMINDPEVDEQTVLDTLDSIDGAIEVKAEAYGHVLRGIKFERAALKAQKDYLLNLADEIDKADDRLNRHEENMKDRLMAAMIAVGKDEEGIEAGQFKFKVVMAGGVQKLEKTGEVPDTFKQIVYKDDDEKIRQYVKENPGCKWARLLPKKRRLQIKGV